jgi:hypothetical protein
MWDTWKKSSKTFENATEQAGNSLTMTMAQ